MLPSLGHPRRPVTVLVLVIAGMFLIASVCSAAIAKMQSANGNCLLTPLRDKDAMPSGSLAFVMKDGGRQWVGWRQRAVPTGFPDLVRVDVLWGNAPNKWVAGYMVERGSDGLWRRTTANTCD
jgi:hypothetical protein